MLSRRMVIRFAACISLASVLLMPGSVREVNTLGELVLNGSAGTGTKGWSAHSVAGPVTVAKAGGSVQVERSGGVGDWAFALATLRSPQTGFQIGRTYRMQAWVREPAGTGAEIGMLLGNGGYGHRPTEVSRYAGARDRGWHLLSRTFVCTAPAFADTALYFELPGSGSFAFQIKGASVREVAAPLPPVVGGPATRTVGFSGPAGSRPDPVLWSYETGGNGWGNDELQTYTASASNAHLDGAGRLVITARRQALTGADGIARKFTSARLTSQNKMVIEPGSYTEASIVAPTGNGVWPAFWLAGADITEVGWPAAGELDILEGWGESPTVAHSAIHLSVRDDPKVHRQYGWAEPGGSTDLGAPLDATAHRYGVYFDQRVAQFFIDHRPTMTVWADDAIAAGSVWPFGRPQHVLLNVAIADTGQDSAADFPKSMIVSPIEVWKGGIPFHRAAPR
jgi:hypothetical protein